MIPMPISVGKSSDYYVDLPVAPAGLFQMLAIQQVILSEKQIPTLISILYGNTFHLYLNRCTLQTDRSINHVKNVYQAVIRVDIDGNVCC